MTFLGYDPEVPFKLAYFKRYESRKSPHLERAVLCFLRDKMSPFQYAYLFTFLGLDPFDSDDENFRALMLLYKQVEHSKMLLDIKEQYEAGLTDDPPSDLDEPFG